MANIQRAPLGRPPAGSWLPRVAAACTVVLALAILKPWAGPVIAPQVTAGPTFYIAPETSASAGGARAYDPRLFGGREPDPAWELWPAGYVVQFGMAGPVRVQHSPAPSPGSSGDPGASPVATGQSSGGTPAPSAAPSEGALPPGVVDLGPSNHLVALGINTPLDARVAEVALWFYNGDDCCLEELQIVRLPTLWESEHFIVIAPGAADGSGTAQPWKVGQYRLDVTTIQGELRQVVFRVRPPIS